MSLHFFGSSSVSFIQILSLSPQRSYGFFVIFQDLKYLWLLWMRSYFCFGMYSNAWCVPISDTLKCGKICVLKLFSSIDLLLVYKNAIDFYELILYQATLLINSNNLSVDLLVFLSKWWQFYLFPSNFYTISFFLYNIGYDL